MACRSCRPLAEADNAVAVDGDDVDVLPADAIVVAEIGGDTQLPVGEVWPEGCVFLADGGEQAGPHAAIDRGDLDHGLHRIVEGAAVEAEFHHQVSTSCIRQRRLAAIDCTATRWRRSSSRRRILAAPITTPCSSTMKPAQTLP